MQEQKVKYYRHAEIENNYFTGIKFLNPFPLFKLRDLGFLKAASFLYGNYKSQLNLDQLKDILTNKVIEPRFLENKDGVLRAIWIGHATVLIQDGPVNIITDPIFHSKVPDAFYGYKRLSPIPITMQNLPKIHAVLISHDHHDHCNTDILKELHQKFNSAFFIGKQSSDLFPKKAKQNVHEMNWTQCIQFQAQGRKYKIHFVPACHWSGRGVSDHFKRLWGGFVIETPEKKKIFYPGDTGYCQVFKEIGDKFGEIDLALLPIGAYMPRQFLCYQHIDPEEAVQVHLDVKAKTSLGIHWATFQLANQTVLQPKEDLQKALVKLAVKQENFICFLPGNTLTCGIPVLRPVFQSQEMKKITWLGHSSIVLQLQGINILVNPVFSTKLNGRHRYTECPSKTSDLPEIDIILVNHNLPQYQLRHPLFQKVPVLTNKKVDANFIVEGNTWVHNHVSIELFLDEENSYFLIKYKDLSYCIPQNLNPQSNEALQPSHLFLPIRSFSNAPFHLQSFVSKYKSINPQRLIPINWGSFQHREENIVQPLADIEQVAKSPYAPAIIVPIIGKTSSF